MKQFGQNDPSCYEWALKTFKAEDEIWTKTLSSTRAAGMPEIQISPMEGQLLEIFVRATGAEKVVEIGTLAGFSTLCLAKGLPAKGQIWTCEFSEKHAQIAEENFRKTEMTSKIKLLVGPALETLKTIEHEAPFDMVFIDADKANYTNYLDWAVKNVRLGGSILADNTFAWGQVAKSLEQTEREPMVQALREYNKAAASHPQLKTTIIPTFEGLTYSVRVA